jgi:hypothetical protein
MLQDVARPAALPAEYTSSSPGRTVIQAWLASRGMIAAVALVLAVVQHRSLTNMVTNWDVQLFAKLASDGYFADPNAGCHRPHRSHLHATGVRPLPDMRTVGDDHH